MDASVLHRQFYHSIASFPKSARFLEPAPFIDLGCYFAVTTT